MKLAPIDRELLEGVHGEAAARAMAILVRYGDAVGADTFIDIGSAHIDGCMYHGQSSIDFVDHFVRLRGRVRVPTTLNAAAVDVVHPEWHCGPAGLLAEQALLTELYEKLGCVPTLTCAPYQRMVRPAAGEHVAWAESNAIVFVNSVLGARTDRYGDFADLCAALTGRVPLAGLHCDAARKPALIVALPPLAPSELPRELYFGAAGYVTGQVAQGAIPFVTGLPGDSSEDDLKAFGAAGASSGALALFHAEGITPEAPAMSVDELPVHPVSASGLAAGIAGLCKSRPGEPVAAVCLGTPHYSVDEFTVLNRALQQGGGFAAVPFVVTTSREIAAIIDQDPAFDPLRTFGVQILVDTCAYLAPVIRSPSGLILTTSVKFAHYGPGNLVRSVALATLDRCIRSARIGALAG